MACRDVWRACVDEFPVYFVGEEIEVVLLDDVAELVHFAARVEISCRVVRVADEDGFGALCDEFLEFFYWRECETGVNGGGDCLDDCTCRHCESHVVCVCWLRNDDLVAWVEAGEECEEHSFGSTAGDDDVVRGEVDVELAVVFHKFLAKRQKTLARAVFQHAPVHIFQCFKCFLWRREVRLTDVQVIDLDASFLGAVCEWGEFSDWR